MNIQELRKINLEATKKALKESVTRDILVIQAGHTIIGLDGVINSLLANLRERYGYYAPRTAREADNETLLKSAEELKKEDMGINLNSDDLNSIKELCEQIYSLNELKGRQERYLDKLTDSICPETKKAATALIAAQLISLAGSLKHLAEIPSSTVQVLGAEKALFRHIRTGAKAPRFGVIFAHPLIANAKEGEKGRIARRLASKISIAVKMDYFRDKK